MGVNWGALLIVCVVSLAVGVVIVSLASFAMVGLSARERAAGEVSQDVEPGMSGATGTAIAGVCLLAIVAIVLYGLWLIVA